ncbi:tRNA uridine-5-carboxymethylaminomethyl(34) synthesis enzyme MnmG, partial [Campylobacter coli]|nr:tRNA uridine-5-carboxymethylaminomethyl(34) synthesis enzyme MnmG [Campylobacter coli]
GVNAVLALDNKEPFILRRDEAYIGVLIDDLVIKGTKEPYRMFTSRAEFRLLLREENAIVRLGKYGKGLGLLEDESYQFIENIRLNTQKGLELLLEKEFTPNTENNAFLASIGEEKITSIVNLQKIVARSSFDIEKLKKLNTIFENMDEYSLREILNEAKYYHYIAMQKSQVEKMKNLIDMKIPSDFDFTSVSGLSNEVVEKLQKHKPLTLFAASEISGITPAALDILQIYIKMQKKKS